MILYVITILIAIIMIAKVIMGIYNLNFCNIFLQDDIEDKQENIKKKNNVLLLIPVLREQNIIESTLEHFSDFELSNVNLHIVIAGTIREKIEFDNFNHKLSTESIVLSWIRTYQKRTSGEYPKFYFTETDDIGGDRATQLNYAVEYFTNHYANNIDIIGVYDADSLPDKDVLIEAVSSFKNQEIDACQQPVHFIDAANRLAKEKANPILVANALYQTNWTFIRELPQWQKYFNFKKNKKRKIYNRNVYLIGHGEFISYKTYRSFNFPEGEITDGIQLGYRMTMCDKIIKPLKSFCSDDVPTSISQIISQHKRWFGGCMRLLQAYNWSKKNSSKRPLLQLLDGFWSQLSWAFAAPLSIFGLITGFLLGNSLIVAVISTCLIVYVYLLPIVSTKLLKNFLNIRINVRIIDWMSLPLAIMLKAVGPNLYFLEKGFVFLKKDQKINYKKVER